MSTPEGRGVSAPEGRQAPVPADFAPNGRRHLAVGDERSEEPTESVDKYPSPEGAAARAVRVIAFPRASLAAALSGLVFLWMVSVGSSLRSSPTAKGCRPFGAENRPLLSDSNSNLNCERSEHLKLPAKPACRRPCVPIKQASRLPDWSVGPASRLRGGAQSAPQARRKRASSAPQARRQSPRSKMAGASCSRQASGTLALLPKPASETLALLPKPASGTLALLACPAWFHARDMVFPKRPIDWTCF
jgi:hypothetical protein